MEYTTASPDEKIPTTNQNNNEIVHTTIPTSLNLTFPSTNLVENLKSTSIEYVVKKTEEINTQEKTLVILVAVSNIEFEEKIIKFFIHFGLYEIFANSKRVKFPIEITTTRELRALETQEVECNLLDDEVKGDMHTYLCEVQTTSTQNITSIKIYNQFEFSSRYSSTSVSCSLLIEQYLDNIKGIGNKFDNIMNSTLYTLEYPKIFEGEK